MAIVRRLTAAVTHEDDWYVAQCLEVEVASQGKTVEEALANLKEALELFFEGVAANGLAHRVSDVFEAGADDVEARPASRTALPEVRRAAGLARVRVGALLAGVS